MYDAVVDRITRWAPELKDHFERAAAGKKVKHKPLATAGEKVKHKSSVSSKLCRGGEKPPARPKLCQGCVIDGVHLECSFGTRVPGGKAMVRHPDTVCLLCSETRLKRHYGVPLVDRQDFRPQGTGRICARLLKIFYAWREEHPAVYDAAMDRITRWVPELRDHFERLTDKAKVQHKPTVGLEERAVVDKQQCEGQWALAKASQRRTSAPPSFVRKRKCQDEAPVRVTKSRGQG